MFVDFKGACARDGPPAAAAVRPASRAHTQPCVHTHTARLAAHAPTRGVTRRACWCHRWSASHARRSLMRWMRTGSDSIGEEATSGTLVEMDETHTVQLSMFHTQLGTILFQQTCLETRVCMGVLSVEKKARA
eukprot:scaffold65812_cov63-Phaeocystis_antarctica.AAC.1